MGDTIPWGDPRSIWPGPDHNTLARARRGVLGHAMRLWAVRMDAADERRTRGIALGHVRARARKERFRSWLYSNYQDRAARLVDEHASPVAALLAEPLVLEGVCRSIGGDWFERWSWSARLRELARKVMGSRRWCSLPWQQEPAPRG
jgi:hypothetical protein